MGNSVDIDWETGEVRAVRKLRSSGSSTVLTIPQEVYESIGLEEGDHVRIIADMETNTISIVEAAD